jgi:hypothetical protein
MRKRSLLIDEYPLLVLPSLAVAVGLNEAIVLQQLHYWLNNPKGGVEMDGYRWVYNTYEQWQADNFPFWSVSTVKRTFTNLEDMELVVSRQQATYDRKKYYRIHEVNLTQWKIPGWDDASDQVEPIDDAKVSPSLTETTSETTQINNDSSASLIWEQVFDAIRPNLKGNHLTYVRGVKPVSITDGVLTLGASDELTREWLQDRLTSTVNRLLIGILKTDAAGVVFEVTA